MIIFTVVFSNIAGIGTGGVPAPLFYLAGLTFWNYFSLCLTTISTTFVSNSQLFGKVYFPRLVAPFSVIISNIFKLGIQFILFVAFWLYYYFTVGFTVDWLWLLPGVVLVTLIFGLLSLGFGLIVTALTTKYRDFYFLVQFGVQLLMYLTPVIYAVGTFPSDKQWIIWANPLSAPIEAFRHWCMGAGVLDWGYMGYSFGFSVAILLLGIVLFNRVEKDFTDTV
jgi:lipopolysaccharide transport system permease protein